MRDGILIAVLVIGAVCLIIGGATAVSSGEPAPPRGMWLTFTLIGGVLCGAVLLIGTRP